MRAHFFSSHLEGIKRRLGSGAADSGWISLSRVNQSISGSKDSPEHGRARHDVLAVDFLRNPHRHVRALRGYMLTLAAHKALASENPIKQQQHAHASCM